MITPPTWSPFWPPVSAGPRSSASSSTSNTSTGTATLSTTIRMSRSNRQSTPCCHDSSFASFRCQWPGYSCRSSRTSSGASRTTQRARSLAGHAPAFLRATRSPLAAFVAYGSMKNASRRCERRIHRRSISSLLALLLILRSIFRMARSTLSCLVSLACSRQRVILSSFRAFDELVGRRLGAHWDPVPVCCLRPAEHDEPSAMARMRARGS
ncbi:hypothetical protein EXIGLDRAFT_47669 [Exidia glandulosa HHB12029]|uniref:Uncharacterized protein n=1 Tax=Exidia glandulosa HHB12029 TaxID=1314781 RepID=A0A165P5T2_EXIGL|nr:hypothetical protein EXIGLDRAFT_47669 [Exidia glandulosa HHB12029]